MREECKRLDKLKLEQQGILERRKEKLKEVFTLFDQVQEDFRLNPSLSESLFYAEDDGDDHASAAVDVTEGRISSNSTRHHTPVVGSLERLDTSDDK